MTPYFPIPELIRYISEPNRSACYKLYNHILEKFPKAPGSSHNHQAWEGGYFDHIQEVMNWAFAYYDLHTKTKRQPPFGLPDALLVLFLHDIEKPWKHDELSNYISPPSAWSDGTLEDHVESAKHKPVLRNWKDRKVKEQFRYEVLRDFGITLTSEQQNAFKYVEGEIDEYSGDHRVMNELAAFCHICDITSARIYHNYPNKDDKWQRMSNDH